LVALVGLASQDVDESEQLLGLQTMANGDFAQPVPEERRRERPLWGYAVVDAATLEEEIEFLDADGEVPDLGEARASGRFKICVELVKRGIAAWVRPSSLDSAHQRIHPASDSLRVGYRSVHIAEFIGRVRPIFMAPSSTMGAC
jgi:hypothetical protein